jgi:endoglucanase
MKMMNQQNIFRLPGILSVLFILSICLFSPGIFSQVCNTQKNILLSGTPSIPFQRGLNVVDWFNEPSAGQIQIDRYSLEDLQTMRDMGCQAIRMAIDLLHLAGPAPEYELDTLFFEFLDMAVDRAEAAGLFIVLLDGSWDPVAATDPSIEPVLLSTWTQLASHLKNRSNHVMYEVLNEPHGISDSQWNTIQGHAIQAIRTEDQTHTIVVTPVNYSAYASLSAMSDYADTNLLYTFHFYSPLLFTHQGTSWGDPVPIDLVGVPFPYDASSMPALPASLAGTWWEDMYNDYPTQGNETWVKSQLDIAVQFQTDRNVRLWCGEFGAYNAASPSEDRATWSGIVRSYLEEKGIAWTYFTASIFEPYTAGCLETDVDTMIASAVGLIAPAQVEPATEPDTSGIIFYEDYLPHGLLENGWFSDGEYDLYSKESPYEGESCLKIAGLNMYGTVSFRFCSYRDLSYLVNHGCSLDFWVRCASPEAQVDIRFEDTKTSPDDHPWRKSITLTSSIVAWDGVWHHLSIPLTDFVETGSWDNNEWFNPEGRFDWHATDLLTIDATDHSLVGIEIFFDNIRITDPVTPVNLMNAPLEECQLQQNYPNPFSQSTTISYSLPEPVWARLRIYDITGRNIITLVDQYQNADTYSVRFEAIGLASGIYYYELTGDDFSRTKKMMLAK